MTLTRSRRRRNGAFITLLATAATLQQSSVYGFTIISPVRSYGQSHYKSSGRIIVNHESPPPRGPVTAASSTSLNMFMGSDGGILGVGTPEIVSDLIWKESMNICIRTCFLINVPFVVFLQFTILLVGYFILGPSDLYKVVKEIGKFVQNIQSFSTDLTKTFENNMEDQLQLNEIRKAQQELTDAFSFRRTINVDQEEEAFATTVDSPRGETPAAAAVASSSSGKKIIRRRAKKKEPEDSTVPDLEMPMDESVMAAADENVAASVLASVSEPALASDEPELTPEELAIIDQEFEQYTSSPLPSSSSSESSSSASSWFQDEGVADKNDESDLSAAARFQQQLSGTWNNQVLANEDKLEPLAAVMQKIALLQEEKAAAEARLQEEFQRREQLEQEFYDKQKVLLEEAAVQIQSQAFAGMVGSGVEAMKNE